MADADGEGGTDDGGPSSEEQLRKEKEALVLQLADSEKAMAELRKENEALSKGGSAASRSWVLDIAVGECEFASAFAYFLEVQLQGHAEKRRTETSPPSERPVFANSSLLLTVGADFAEENLQVSAFLNVVDPSASEPAPAAKLLGTGVLPLQELKVTEHATTSKRLARKVNFVRAPEGGEGKPLVVGVVNIVMQVKALSSAPAPAAASRLDAAHTVASAVAPSLDKSLWQTRPFESRLHILVHRADALPVPEASAKAVVRVAARLLQPGGHVLQELASRNLPVEPVTAHMGEVWFNQEIVMSMSASMLEASGLQVGLALEMVSSTPDGAVTDSLLNLQWLPSSLPFLNPIHLHARSSAATSASSASRPRPGLLVSITREPGHEALDGLGGGVSHGLEIRVHGVPHGRPLPDLVEGGLVAVCPESSVGTDTRDLRIPVATYLYDQRIELSAFLDEHFITAASNARCFLSPLSGASRTPQWGQFLLRCLSSATSLKAVTILLFECRGARADPDSPLSGNLLGFASLDASSLIGSEPMSRSFLLDLRLLEAPGASTSLEIEARVWPRGGGGTAEGPHGKSAPAPAPALAPSAALAQEVQDFRLNHELSVQLSKEFNMRAAALKRAGEEIVTLRRQVQLLKNENRSLRAQVEDEEKLAHEVQQRPPPEGLEKLSAAELAGKLQRTLEKYREEKAKASELTRRMEEALKEVNRARALERSLEELQQVHLEQNRELQRLQDEGRKLDTYRQTAKTQEKVISKLEKILESSLQEVQKAQKVQVDIERLKTENLKLRERCSSLLTRKKEVGDDEAQELRQRLAEKDAEITRLQKVAASLKMNNVEAGEETVVPLSSPGTAALSAEEQEQLAHLEAKRFEWEQRCAAAEQRLQVLQQQLTESSKRYGAEISSLEVEIAKKDARIKELEFLQRQTA